MHAGVRGGPRGPPRHAGTFRRRSVAAPPPPAHPPPPLLLQRLLADKGADLDKADHNGWTPALVAAECGNLDVLKFLHKRKARLHGPNTDGVTAVHIAAGEGNVHVIRFLARNGADLRHVAADGASALDDARLKDQPQAVALLEAVESAGGSWRQYVGVLRMPLCRIRYEVSRGRLVLPEGDELQALYHFMFGGQDEAVGDDGAVLRAAPSDVFGLIGSFLYG